MPDWSYHTVLRPVVARLPGSFLRAWGSSRLGAGVVRFFAHAQVDRRIGARVGPDAEGIARQLGVGFTRRGGEAVADPGVAVRELRERGEVVLDLRVGGPGLAKRVHEAVTPSVASRPRWGFVLLGLGMMVAGLGAALVAATRVVLPYDESFVEVPAGLLPFLAHDRMTLAGTMVAIGILYAAVAWFAPDAPWARRAMAASAALGFGNFFLFLVFGYFDPLHAAVSLALLPFFLWGVWPRSRGSDHVGALPDVANDRAWRRAQWGILGLVALAVGLTVGGVTIAVLGSTRVFVASDLVFIGPMAMEPRLVALVAHDRAGFGGALACNGVLLALTAMWGIRRGLAWLWWAYVAAGVVGFGSAVGVHFWVGYTDLWHLAPVLVGTAVWAASLAALRSYMCMGAEAGAAALAEAGSETPRSGPAAGTPLK